MNSNNILLSFDFAEDFAYDEFGEDSWEAYEYGYEEAYDYWMDEMGE